MYRMLKKKKNRCQGADNKQQEREDVMCNGGYFNMVAEESPQGKADF